MLSDIKGWDQAESRRDEWLSPQSSSNISSWHLRNSILYRKKIDDWTEPTIKYHLTITNRLALEVTGKFVAKDVEKLDPSYIVGVAVIHCGHFENQFESCSACQNTD